MRSRPWLPYLLTTVLVLGCSPGSEGPEPPIETHAPPPDEQAEPAPPQDVEGEVEAVNLADLSSSGGGLYPDGSANDAPVPVDQGAVDAAVSAAVAWLDAHLTDVQSGGPGLVVDTDLVGDPTPVSEGLTDPDHPVTAATYTVTAGVRGLPEWVQVAASIAREDGTMAANFVFTPEGDEVQLLAVHPGAGTPVATP